MSHQKILTEEIIFTNSKPLATIYRGLFSSPSPLPPPSPLVTTNPEGVITETNGALLQELGFTRHELLGQPLANCLYSDMPPALLHTRQTTVAAGLSWRGMIKYRGKNGEAYWSDTTTIPLMEHGRITSLCSVLSPPSAAVTKRAAELLHSAQPPALFRPFMRFFQFKQFLQFKPRLPPFNSFGLSHRLLALIGLPAAAFTLLALWRADWLAAAILFITGAVSLLLGWRLLGNLRRLSRTTQQTAADPLLCYLYTGGTDEACWMDYALGKRTAEVRALTAYINHTGNILGVAETRKNHFLAHATEALQQQSQAAKVVAQALRSILEDQHFATAAVTQAQQLAFNIQNINARARAQLKRVHQTTRHQLARLEQSRPTLQDMAARIGSVKQLIEKIGNITDESLLILTPDPTAGEVPDRTILKHIQQRTQSTRAAINTLQLIFTGLHSSTQTALAALETGIQASTQTLGLTQDIDHIQQTTSSLVNRINLQAVDVGNIMHHQSITRATATHRLALLQGHLATTLEANKKASDQSEKLGGKIAELYMLADTLLKNVN